MNCRPGDLAVLVRPEDPRNLGALVLVVRHTDLHGIWLCEALQNMWFWDAPLRPGERGFAADEALRPLRDSDGDDETLAWAPNPQQVAA